MPNRVIKESIRTSRGVNALNDFQFRLWMYLITYVDDYGRGSADPELLKGLVFPRRKGVTEKQIEDALVVLANTGMVILYEVGGEPFFYFSNWSEHQRIQAKKAKFPEPPELGQIHRDSPWVTVGHRESPPKSNPIQIQYETESNTNTIGLPAKANRPKEPYSDLFFVKFWETYPRKEKKLNAWKAWEKLKVDKDLSGTIIQALEAWKKCDQWQDVKFIPHPATFLNAHQWEDVPTIVKSRVELEAEEEERKRKAFVEADFEEESYEE